MPSKSSGTRPQPDYLLLGEILRPHGIDGEVRMRVLTAYPERLIEIKTIYLGRDPEATQAVEYAVERIRMHQGYALLKLEGINDRSQADTLRQLVALIPLKDAVPLEEGEFYLYQLIGLAVHTEDGEHLGTLTDVLETGANDVYIVDSPTHGEILIPVTAETILRTDIASGVVVVKLPEGLLPNR